MKKLWFLKALGMGLFIGLAVITLVSQTMAATTTYIEFDDLDKDATEAQYIKWTIDADADYEVVVWITDDNDDDYKIVFKTASSADTDASDSDTYVIEIDEDDYANGSKETFKTSGLNESFETLTALYVAAHTAHSLTFSYPNSSTNAKITKIQIYGTNFSLYYIGLDVLDDFASPCWEINVEDEGWDNINDFEDDGRDSNNATITFSDDYIKVTTPTSTTTTYPYTMYPYSSMYGGMYGSSMYGGMYGSSMYGSPYGSMYGGYNTSAGYGSYPYSPYGSSYGSPYGSTYGSPYGSTYGSPYGSTYGSPYGSTYGSPYGSSYGSPYGSSYGSPYGSSYGSPYGSSYGSPYGSSYGSPYGSSYGAYGSSYSPYGNNSMSPYGNSYGAPYGGMYGAQPYGATYPPMGLSIPPMGMATGLGFDPFGFGLGLTGLGAFDPLSLAVMSNGIGGLGLGFGLLGLGLF